MSDDIENAVSDSDSKRHEIDGNIHEIGATKRYATQVLLM